MPVSNWSTVYRHKNINCHFVIVCHDSNVSGVKNTASSIRGAYPYSVSCVVPQDTHPDDVEMVKKTCPVSVGGTTITSLLNAGICNGGPEWNFIIMSGSWVRPGLDTKFSYFIENEKDILFPIVDRQINFVDATLNGILVHRKTFEEIGKFADNSPLEICKLFWAMDAIEKGCRFKAIVGTQVC